MGTDRSILDSSCTGGEKNSDPCREEKNFGLDDGSGQVFVPKRDRSCFSIRAKEKQERAVSPVAAAAWHSFITLRTGLRSAAKGAGTLPSSSAPIRHPPGPVARPYVTPPARPEVGSFIIFELGPKSAAKGADKPLSSGAPLSRHLQARPKSAVKDTDQHPCSGPRS